MNMQQISTGYPFISWCSFSLALYISTLKGITAFIVEKGPKGFSIYRELGEVGVSHIFLHKYPNCPMILD